MKSLERFLMLFIILTTTLNFVISAQDKPSLCFTFDDGTPKNILDYNYLNWNRMILDTLKAHNLQAIFYVCAGRMDSPEGKNVLQAWDDAGNLIANHTYTHLNYNSKDNTFEKYKNEILKCDSFICRYKNYTKHFRAPILKYGNTKAKRDSLVYFLKSIGYKNGYVTIDASDWYVNSKLIEFIQSNPGKSIEKYKQFYIEHLLDRAAFYDDLAFKLLGRRVKHSILLHHNLTSALFLGDLIKAFEKKGWKLINAKEALTDDVYKMVPDIVPAGESIIWGLAKESGKYENILRYPGEDSIYEDERMNKLGL